MLVNRDFKDKNSFKRGFKWNGIELKLKELGEEEDKDKMLNQLYFSNFTSLMDFINQDCLWKKFPKFVKENEIVDKNLLTLYSRINSKPGLDNSKKEYQKICGSFESFYKETIK